jgi:hypothetical protein
MSGTACWIRHIWSQKVEKRAGIEGLSGRDDDWQIGWSALKKGYGIRFPEAGVSSDMDLGKELQVKMAIKKRHVSEWQSRWH